MKFWTLFFLLLCLCYLVLLPLMPSTVCGDGYAANMCFVAQNWKAVVAGLLGLAAALASIGVFMAAWRRS